MNVMEVQPRRILELATLDGAKDLGIADRSGSLTPGKRADLILVRTNDINVAPFVNPALLLVQQTNPSNVDTVLIDGRTLKHKGELVSIDTEEVINKAAEAFHAARKRAGGRTKRKGCQVPGASRGEIARAPDYWVGTDTRITNPFVFTPKLCLHPFEGPLILRGDRR